MKYPLAYNTWNRKEEEAIQKVIKSKKYTMGNMVKNFEKDFSKKFKSKYALMVNSGSSANLLMFSLLRYYNGIFDKKIKKPNIIAPAIGWSTSYFPISQNNFEINFVDVNLKTLNIDCEKIENSIDKNTIGILAINLVGNPCNFKKLKTLCKKYKLILLEDNCESLCAKYENKFTGTFGEMASHSLYFAHHLQTMEGGVLLTNNRDFKDYLRSLRAHGWCRDLPKINKLYKFKNDEFQDFFKFITPGYCVRPLEIQGAVGSVQLKKLKSFMKIRLKNAKKFKELFSNKNWCQIQIEEKNAVSSWHGFNIILQGKLKNKRDRIIRRLISNGVDTRPTMTGNFLKNPVIKKLKYKSIFQLNNTNFIDKNGFFIGNYPKDLSNEIEYAYKIITNEKY
jgi:CDP-6-deoxy-D-xylo-4-hexulose-3-dehydrase